MKIYILNYIKIFRKKWTYFNKQLKNHVDNSKSNLKPNVKKNNKKRKSSSKKKKKL